MSGTTFDSKSKNIGELIGVYTRERLEIPEFQRGYSWGRTHTEALWDDIVRFGKDDNRKKYFLGPIVTLEGQNDVVWLLDGQQRLATTIIILSVLRDLARAVGTSEAIRFAEDIQNQFIRKENAEYSLTMGETDKTYFRNTVQVAEPLNDKPKLRTHLNIQRARAFFSKKLEALIAGSTPEAKLMLLRQQKATISTDLVMANIPVASERDAFQIFETLNDRGLRLSAPDLLLNYLMREANPETDRVQIRELWTEIVEKMGRRDINRFLQHMWRSKYGDLKKTDLFSALKDHIESQEISSLDFTRTCAEECETYVQLLNFDETLLATAKTDVQVLLRNLNIKAAIPLLLACVSRVPASEFKKICQYVLVFVVRYSIIAGLESSGMEDVFFALAREVRTMIDTSSSDQRPPSVVKHIKEVLANKAASEELIKTNVKELVVDPDEASYLISKIANHMQSQTRETGANDANLEHIYPKRPKPLEWGGKAGQDNLNPYLWHIGNLTWLGSRLNDGAANSEFASKKTHYQKTSELVITQNLANQYTEWNEETIKDRAEKLTKSILEIWNFDNPSRV